MAKNIFSGWKKFSTNGKNTIMAHPSGHRMIIQHKNLRPEHLEQLHSLEFHTNDKKGETPKKLAQGASVRKDDIPEPNKKAAADMQKGALSGSTSASQAWSNLKSGLGFADGGEVKPNKQTEETLRKTDQGQELIDQIQDPELARAMMMEPRRKMADGGQVAIKNENYSEGFKKEYPGVVYDTETPSKDWDASKRPQDAASRAPAQAAPTKAPEETEYDPMQDAQINRQPKKKMADGGEVDSSIVPVEQASIAPQVPEDVLQLRQIYNSLAMPAVDAKGGVPDADAASDRMFGPNGEAPRAALDVSLVRQAQAKQAEAKQAQMAQQAQNNASSGVMNEARQTMGMGALPQQETPGATAPQQPQFQAQAAPTMPQQATNAAMDPTKIMEQGIMQQKAGMQQEAAATAKLGQQQDQMLQEQVNLQHKAVEQYQAHYQGLENERQALIKDINNGHIDSNRYISNLGVAGSIATALGLIAGGMGGGMNGHENYAMKFLNAQIDRDIESQKMDLNKKENLLSANMRQFGNLNQATEMTRIMQTDIVSNQLKQAAAKAQGPLAKARLMQAAGALDQQSAPALAKLAGRQTLNSLVKQYGHDPKHAQDIINAAQNVDPEIAKDYQGRYVPGMGFANTADDAKSLKEMSADANAARASIQRLKSINMIGGKSLSPTLRTEAQGLAAGLVGQLNRPFTGGGPMSEGERKLIESIARNPTALLSLDSSNAKALDTLEGMLNVKMSEAAKSRGLTSPGVKEFKHRPVK